MKRKSMMIGAAVAALALSACGGKATEPFHDGPRSGVVNKSASDLIESPDGFSNASTKCDHGNRLYFVFKGDDNRAAMGVVPKDPTCPQPPVTAPAR